MSDPESKWTEYEPPKHGLGNSEIKYVMRWHVGSVTITKISRLEFYMALYSKKFKSVVRSLYEAILAHLKPRLPNDPSSKK